MKISDPGIGNENADAGSEEWAKYWRLAMQTALKNANFDQERVLVLWEHGKQHRAWTKLNRKDGGTFKQWEEFVSDALPWGLGSKPESVRAILESRKGYRSTQRETVPEPQQGKREASTTELQKLNPETTRRLRAINRAPEIVGKLYDEGLISQVDAAKLGKKGIDTVEVAGELAKVVEETKSMKSEADRRKAIKEVAKRLSGGKPHTTLDNSTPDEACVKAFLKVDNKLQVLDALIDKLTDEQRCYFIESIKRKDAEPKCKSSTSVCPQGGNIGGS